jgi:uncharacterized RDD family membrane protein YckC
MPRVLALYKGHESARMLELEGARLASFPARALAFAIDMAIVGFSFVVPAMAAAAVAIKMGWIRDHVHITFDPFHHEHWESLVWMVVFIAGSNYVGNGATIGKKILRIRAVSLVHSRLSLWHSIERALGYGASALEAFFGFFQFFIDPNRQTVHDRIAKTIVVSERKRGKLTTAAEEPVAASELEKSERPTLSPTTGDKDGAPLETSAQPANPEPPESSAPSPASPVY